MHPTPLLGYYREFSVSPVTANFEPLYNFLDFPTSWRQQLLKHFDMPVFLPTYQLRPCVSLGMLRLHDRPSPHKDAIAYSRRFTIPHLPTKKRSLSHKEKAIAFVQLLRSASTPQSPIIKAIALN